MLKPVFLHDKQLRVPIIQGGMGVGISLGNLAGHVMKEGGMGVISAAHPGYADPDFYQDPIGCNRKALAIEADKARQIGKDGLLGVNIMVASRDYEEYVRASVECGYDAIISGAGLPLSLPAYVPKGTSLIAPIISSAKAGSILLKMWDRRYLRMPDFIVIEGAKAGGHLGFKKDELLNHTYKAIKDIVVEVREMLAGFEKKYHTYIPVFAAGGIFTHQDIQEVMACGADGVQIGSRFIATHECDAHSAFKDAILQAGPNDVGIIDSPAGLPGRAVKNEWLTHTKNPVTRCIRCLKSCDPKTTPYCITQALIEAVKGNISQGLVFAGENVGRIRQMMSVHELMEELTKGTEE